MPIEKLKEYFVNSGEGGQLCVYFDKVEILKKLNELIDEISSLNHSMGILHERIDEIFSHEDPKEHFSTGRE